MRTLHEMTTLIALTMALTLGSSGLDAQDTKGGQAEQVLAKLQEEHDASTLGYREKAEHFKPRYERLVEEFSGTEAALTAQLWLLRACWWQREEGTMNESAGALAETVLDRHPRSEQLAELAHMDWLFSGDQKTAIFGRVLEITPHDSVKATMHLALARGELRSDPAAARDRLLMLSREYSTQPYRHSTVGAMADAYLNPHAPEDLVIGKKAPEIEGKDLDGKPMKLSDYRGNVVVLDFWGDW